MQRTICINNLSHVCILFYVCDLMLQYLLARWFIKRNIVSPENIFKKREGCLLQIGIDEIKFFCFGHWINPFKLMPLNCFILNFSHVNNLIKTDGRIIVTFEAEQLQIQQW